MIFQENSECYFHFDAKFSGWICTILNLGPTSVAQVDVVNTVKVYYTLCSMYTNQLKSRLSAIL